MPGVDFLEHDATVLPWPVEAPNVAYARLLLGHLPDHGAVMSAWCGAIAAGGRLLLDEVEAVETDDPVVRTYLDDVAIPVVTSQSGHLIVGPAMHEMADPYFAARVHDEVVTLRAPTALTARMFSMNLDVLAGSGEIAPRPDLSEGLAAIAADPSAAMIVWHMRQIAYERR
ncbi:MAG TPA: hypothetical protein VNC60_04445 [Actinomycetota bacterium]|nr:hypothetical protein [Actinomycetota bacterium]